MYHYHDKFIIVIIVSGFFFKTRTSRIEYGKERERERETWWRILIIKLLCNKLGITFSKIKIKIAHNRKKIHRRKEVNFNKILRNFI